MHNIAFPYIPKHFRNLIPTPTAFVPKYPTNLLKITHRIFMHFLIRLWNSFWSNLLALQNSYHHLQQINNLGISHHFSIRSSHSVFIHCSLFVHQNNCSSNNQFILRTLCLLNALRLSQYRGDYMSPPPEIIRCSQMPTALEPSHSHNLTSTPDRFSYKSD